MARLNNLKLNNLPPLAAEHGPRTHEGATAVPLAPYQALRRTVLSALLWENECYESGETIATRARALVPLVEPSEAAALAVEAREQMHLRHMPLLLVREMARSERHRSLVADTLSRVIQRADELAEFLALYWLEGRQPLSGQVKKGLARAFTKFDAYALAKYDRAAPVRLRDVLFLCHAKPVDLAQAELWRQLIDGTLAAPDTWEVRISAAGRDAEARRQAWDALLGERRLGAMALLRNLRKLEQAGVERELIRDALAGMHAERVLPFRFLAAARHAPRWKPELESAMLGSVSGHERLRGRTALLVDVSGSMDAPLARR